MTKTASICSFVQNRWPRPEEVRSFFFQYNPSEWSQGGTRGHSLVFYGAENTGYKEPFKDRIDIELVIEDDPEAGQYLMYSKTGAGYVERYYSLGDMSRTSEIVTTLEDHALSRALFIPRHLSWLAVEDFLNGEGRRSDRIEWISGKDLPRDLPA